MIVIHGRVEPIYFTENNLVYLLDNKQEFVDSATEDPIDLIKGKTGKKLEKLDNTKKAEEFLEKYDISSKSSLIKAINDAIDADLFDEVVLLLSKKMGLFIFLFLERINVKSANYSKIKKDAIYISFRDMPNFAFAARITVNFELIANEPYAKDLMTEVFRKFDKDKLIRYVSTFAKSNFFQPSWMWTLVSKIFPERGKDNEYRSVFKEVNCNMKEADKIYLKQKFGDSFNEHTFNHFEYYHHKNATPLTRKILKEEFDLRAKEVVRGKRLPESYDSKIGEYKESILEVLNAYAFENPNEREALASALVQPLVDLVFELGDINPDNPIQVRQFLARYKSVILSIAVGLQKIQKKHHEYEDAERNHPFDYMSPAKNIRRINSKETKLLLSSIKKMHETMQWGRGLTKEIEEKYGILVDTNGLWDSYSGKTDSEEFQFYLKDDSQHFRSKYSTNELEEMDLYKASKIKQFLRKELMQELLSLKKRLSHYPLFMLRKTGVERIVLRHVFRTKEGRRSGGFSYGNYIELSYAVGINRSFDHELFHNFDTNRDNKIWEKVHPEGKEIYTHESGTDAINNGQSFVQDLIDTFFDRSGFAYRYGQDGGVSEDQATMAERIIRKSEINHRGYGISREHFLERCKTDEILRNKLQMITGCLFNTETGRFDRLLTLEEYTALIKDIDGKPVGFKEFQYYRKWSTDEKGEQGPKGKVWFDHDYWNAIIDGNPPILS